MERGREFVTHGGQGRGKVLSTNIPSLNPDMNCVAKVLLNSISRYRRRDFPGGPVARTPYSQCRGSGFNPWSGN